MEKKSRVIKYQSLRKKISNMDVYSFVEQEDVAKNLPPVSHLSPEENPLPPSSDGIKKNTLSVTLDELIASHESYFQESEKKEMKERYKQKQKERKRREHTLTQGGILLAVFIPLCLIVVAFIILFVTGVF